MLAEVNRVNMPTVSVAIKSRDVLRMAREPGDKTLCLLNIKDEPISGGSASQGVLQRWQSLGCNDSQSREGLAYLLPLPPADDWVPAGKERAVQEHSHLMADNFWDHRSFRNQWRHRASLTELSSDLLTSRAMWRNVSRDTWPSTEVRTCRVHYTQHIAYKHFTVIASTTTQMVARNGT